MNANILGEALMNQGQSIVLLLLMRLLFFSSWGRGRVFCEEMFTVIERAHECQVVQPVRVVGGLELYH